jgi:uncharacterized protein YndB with AHSA1/START domain
MASTTQDRIERVVDLPVSPTRAWAAITEPEQISQWFGDRVEFELQPGAMMLFGWGEIKFRGRIAAVEPITRFAYHWVNRISDDPEIPVDETSRTLVEFLLEPTESGTRLTLFESGFASLPADYRDEAFAENSQGWNAELGDLEQYLTQPVSIG